MSRFSVHDNNVNINDRRPVSSRSLARSLFVPSPSHYSSLSVAHDFRLCIRTCESYLRAFIVCSFFLLMSVHVHKHVGGQVSRGLVLKAWEKVKKKKRKKRKMEVGRREGKEGPKWTSAYFANGFVYLMQNAAPCASRCAPRENVVSFRFYGFYGLDKFAITKCKACQIHAHTWTRHARKTYVLNLRVSKISESDIVTAIMQISISTITFESMRSSFELSSNGRVSSNKSPSSAMIVYAHSLCSCENQ